MIIAPSILNADNLHLGQQIQEAADSGICRFHIDVMDGHFVPNLSYGPQLVSDFKKQFPDLTAEVHLMSNKLPDLLPAFVKAGSDLIEIHYEADYPARIDHWLDYLKENGVSRGLVLSPDTDIKVLDRYKDKVDQVLLMTVYPGFGGQKFMDQAPDRIKAAREILPDLPIEVDGGINDQTAKIAKDAGANVFVAGSYIFGRGSVAKQVAELTSILEK